MLHGFNIMIKFPIIKSCYFESFQQKLKHPAVSKSGLEKLLDQSQ